MVNRLKEAFDRFRLNIYSFKKQKWNFVRHYFKFYYKRTTHPDGQV